MYLFDKNLLSAYYVLGTYARLPGQSCEQQRHSPSPSRDIHLNSTQMKCPGHSSFVLSKPKAQTLKIHSELFKQQSESIYTVWFPLKFNRKIHDITLLN